MIATLRLEAIGDNYVAMSKRPFPHVLRQIGRVPREHLTAVLMPGRRPWVARITGLDDRHGLAREFERGLRDYRQADSTGSRGVWLTFVLRPGTVYEVHELVSWQRERRYFCRVEAGRVVEITREAVLARLASGAVAIQGIINAARGRP